MINKTKNLTFTLNITFTVLIIILISCFAIALVYCNHKHAHPVINPINAYSQDYSQNNTIKQKGE
jgi:hypothetical protein